MAEEQNAIAKWAEGRKTYLTAGAILVCGILDAAGVVIPPYVWGALAALGLAFLRAGVEASKGGGR